MSAQDRYTKVIGSLVNGDEAKVLDYTRLLEFP